MFITITANIANCQASEQELCNSKPQMVRLLIEPGLCVPVCHTWVNVHTGIMRVHLHTDIASLAYVCRTWTYGGDSGPKDRSLHLCRYSTWLTNERNTQMSDTPHWKNSKNACVFTVLFLQSAIKTAMIITSHLKHAKRAVCKAIFFYFSDKFGFLSGI
jgi:hypothetical protein